MKILSANKFYYVKGGSETYAFGLNKLLEEKGHKVIPFSMQDSRNFPTPYEEFFVKNIDYSTGNPLKKILYSLKIIYSLEAKRKIARLLDKERPDIAHLHLFQHQLSPSILPEIKKRGIPIAYTVHDYKPLCPNYKLFSAGKPCEECKGGKYYHCFFNKCTKDSRAASLVNTIEMYFHRLRNYYNHIDIFIAPSDFLRNKMIDFGFDESKIVHIPNFVNLEANNFTDKEEGRYFIYFGRLSEEKGIITLVKAMSKVKEATLLIVGTGPLESEIKQMVKTAKLNNVRLLGFRSGEDLKAIVQGSMFSILPSEWYENNPLSILESFANTKAVIGSKIGGIPELIDENVNGLLFEPGNDEELAEKINYLFSRKKEAAAMGKNARQKIKNEYNAEKHYEKISEVYKELLAS